MQQINLKQAVAIALEQAGTLFNQTPLPPYLEELAYDDHNETWNITISVARPVEDIPLLDIPRSPVRHYKVFNINKKGEVNFIKIREVEPLVSVDSTY